MYRNRYLMTHSQWCRWAMFYAVVHHCTLHFHDDKQCFSSYDICNLTHVTNSDYVMVYTDHAWPDSLRYAPGQPTSNPADYNSPDTYLTKADWQLAYQLQDVPGLNAIVREWPAIYNRIWQEAHYRNMGTDWVTRHPICVLFADKACSLTRAYSGDIVSQAYDTYRNKVK